MKIIIIDESTIFIICMREREERKVRFYVAFYCLDYIATRLKSAFHNAAHLYSDKANPPGYPAASGDSKLRPHDREPGIVTARGERERAFAMNICSMEIWI